ncbi:MAG: thymidine phosphorylase, partial [Lachnospiraceae bacterium]|nr:thymidine phosphorylase [Lachnospiraceae bacterium]
GGDPSYIRHPEKLGRAPVMKEFKASKDGFIVKMDSEGVGIAGMLLGAGRETKESEIDYLAGIILRKKTGDFVKKGDTIAELFTSEEARLDAAVARISDAVVIGSEAPEKRPLIYARVTEQGVDKI